MYLAIIQIIEARIKNEQPIALKSLLLIPHDKKIRLNRSI